MEPIFDYISPYNQNCDLNTKMLALKLKFPTKFDPTTNILTL